MYRACSILNAKKVHVSVLPVVLFEYIWHLENTTRHTVQDAPAMTGALIMYDFAVNIVLNVTLKIRVTSHLGRKQKRNKIFGKSEC